MGEKKAFCVSHLGKEQLAYLVTEDSTVCRIMSDSVYISFDKASIAMVAKHRRSDLYI